MAITSTNNLRKGMKDSNGSTDVLDLQKALNATGKYNLAEDGSFGAKTEAAVKAYQQEMGLKVDGVVGTNTWGKLTSGQNASASNTTPAETKPTTFQYEAYQDPDIVKQAEALVQQQLANKPGDFNGGTWMDTLNDTINKINNREKFSYDLNGDMLYQQYKDQYTTGGKLAMMDTMGQAAAMNGGYGNSYAQTAGQQAYQSYLQQLNDKVPELYQLALSQYNAEGDDMYNKAALLAQQVQQEYGMHRDAVSDYYTELNRLTEDARYKGEDSYKKWADKTNLDYGIFSDQRTYDYQTERDKIADQQWQATFDEGVRQYNASLAEQKRQYDTSLARKQEEDAAKAEQEWEDEVKAAAKSEDVKNLITKLDDDTKYWDAVMRHQYGSEKTYMAQKIENSNLTDAEKAYLISYYGITENDLSYKK